VTRADLERWATGLRKAGHAGSGATPFANRRDDADRTNALPFLAHRGVTHVAPGDRPDRPDPDASLWWALVDRAVDDALRALEAPAESSAQDRGAVFPRGLYSAIEVWTESELSALTALWWLSRLPGAGSLRDAMLASARWHLEHTQPDNATNRPWAIPVFLELAILDNSPDARLFAETLLHNAIAANGTPEPFSAMILLDAADAVDLMMNE
jgi:hypothetical protein